MGYIDDKAREADNTIKGIGIVLVIVIALCCMAGSIEGGLIAFIAIIGIGCLCLILWEVHKHSKKKEEAKKLEEQENKELEETTKRYQIRLSEIGFVKKDQPMIWRKYNNVEGFYSNYFWKDNNKLWEVRTEPAINNYDDPIYKDLSTLKKLYLEIKDINYISLEGNYCVMYYEWKPIYYRRDAIEIFQKFIPEKIK